MFRIHLTYRAWRWLFTVFLARLYFDCNLSCEVRCGILYFVVSCQLTKFSILEHFWFQIKESQPAKKPPKCIWHCSDTPLTFLASLVSVILAAWTRTVSETVWLHDSLAFGEGNVTTLASDPVFEPVTFGPVLSALILCMTQMQQEGETPLTARASAGVTLAGCCDG